VMWQMISPVEALGAQLALVVLHLLVDRPDVLDQAGLPAELGGTLETLIGLHSLVHPQHVIGQVTSGLNCINIFTSVIYECLL
jgi:hypothetical protein